MKNIWFDRTFDCAQIDQPTFKYWLFLLFFTWGDVNFVLSPATVKGEVASTVLTTLDGKAGPAGITIGITSSDSTVANPAVSSVTIPAGSTTSPVTINTFAVPATKTAKITAGSVKYAKLRVTR